MNPDPLQPEGQFTGSAGGVPDRRFCPFCGQAVPFRADRCRYCAAWLSELPDDPSRFRKQGVQATDFLLPTNVSAWAIASCYMGLVGFCLPLLGLLFAAPGLICGIVALTRWKKGSGYGAVTSNIRSIIGVVLSSLGLLIWGSFLVWMMLQK